MRPFFTTPPSKIQGSFCKGDPITCSTSMSVRSDEVVANQLELEKQQLRREIIGSEIVRRQMLEAEVRMELMLEREMEIQRAASVGFPSNDRFAMFPQMYAIDYGPLDERLALSSPTPFSRFLSSLRPQQLSPPQQPFPMPSEISPPTVATMDKLVVLARPEPDISSLKRKAMTDSVAMDNEAARFGLKRKPREEWSCALCHVSASSEKTFNAHLQGKKHKAKVYGLREHANSNTRPLPKESGISSQRIEETAPTNRSDDWDLENRPRKEWSCALCQVNTTGETRFNEHIQGKKHKANEKRLRAQKNSDTVQMPTQDEICSKNNKEAVTTDRSESETYCGGKSLLPKQKEAINEDSNDQNGTTIMQKKVDVKKQARKDKLRFWCEMCGVGVDSLKLMESHKLGRKHMARMKIDAGGKNIMQFRMNDVGIKKVNKIIKDV